LHWDTGDIKDTDASGFLEGITTAGEDLFLLSYAKQLSFGLSIGGSFKFQRQQIAGPSASGYGGDIGLLYRPDLGEGLLENLAFGLTMHNVVRPRLKLINYGEPVPHIIRGGVAKTLRVGPRADQVNLFMAFETLQRYDREEFRFHVGSEYIYQDLAMLRIGYNGEQPSFGGGVIYQMFQIDYALGKYAADKDGNIPLQHRISITMHFGKTKTEMHEMAQARELQRIESETKKQMDLIRRSEFEEKIRAAMTYFQDADYYNARDRFRAAREIAAVASDIFTKEQREEVNVWVEKAQQKLDEQIRAQQQQIAKSALDSAEVQRIRTCVETQYHEGMKLLDAGKLREAVAEWRRGLECDSTDARLIGLIQKTERETHNRKMELLRLARAHEDQGRFVDAIRIYNQVISQNSVTLEEQRAIEDRVAQLQKKLTIEDSFRQGYTEYLNKNYCAAKGLFAQAMQVDPSSAKIKQYYNDSDARCNARLKDFNSDTDRQSFLQAIGLIQHENYEAALRILEEIQKGDRYNKRILDAIDQARERMRKK
jgi:tetratricopeptide (TPR) repeat protein